MRQGGHYYSPDGGASWVGPFDRRQLEDLRARGVVRSSFVIRTEWVAGEQTVTPQYIPSEQRYWVIRDDGQQLGPYTVSDLTVLASAGQIGSATMVYTSGMAKPLSLSALGILPVGGTVSRPGQGTCSEDHFSLGRFFSDVFKSHTQEEVVMELCAGSPFGTPDIRSVNATWPSPWIFARVALFCAIMYLGLYYTMSAYQNPILIPAILFVANFGIPFCVLVLLYEMNIRRDVPFYTVVKALLSGGVLSLPIALFLFDNFKTEAPYWAGPIEEAAKLLAAVCIASSCRNGRILTGILIGCAVGAGFAAFESAGYAMGSYMGGYTDMLIKRCGEMVQAVQQAVEAGNLSPAEVESTVNEGFVKIMQSASVDSVGNLQFVSLLRALLTPAGHVVWTAITAGAYWRVLAFKEQQGVRAAGDRSVDFSAFFDMRFLCIAIIPVGLHMVWNSTIGFEQFGNYRYLILGVIAWIVLLRLAQMGIDQVKEEKRKALPEQ